MKLNKSKIIAAMIGVFLLLPAIFICYLFESDNGTALLLNIIEKKMPGLSFEYVSGHLLGKLDIKNLKYHSQEIDISIDYIAAHNTINLFPIKFINKTLLIKNATITPHIFHLNKKTPASHFRLPFAVEANNVIMNDLIIQAEKHKLFLPTLRARLKLNSKISNIVLYKDANTEPFLNFFQNKKTAYMNLQLPIQGAQLDLIYSANKDQFSLNGIIKDSHHGNAVINAIGNDKKGSHVKLTAQNMHVDDLWANYWPGVVNIDLNVNHYLDNTHITLKKLSGSIHNQPLSGEGKLTLKNNSISSLQLNLSSQRALLAINENKKNKELIDWLINVPDIHRIFPTYEGKIIAKGNIQGINLKPIFNGQFIVRDLVFDQYKIKNMTGNFLVNTKSNDGLSYLQLQANNLLLKKFAVTSVHAEGKGSLSNHNFNLAMKAKEQSMNLTLHGHYMSSHWDGTLKNLILVNKMQKWAINQSTNITLTKQSISLEPLNMISNQSKIALQGKYFFGENLQGKCELQDLDMGLFNVLMPEDSKLEGKISAKATVDLKEKKFSINGELKKGGIYYTLNKEKQQNLFYGGKFNAEMEGENLIAQMNLLFPEGELSSKIIAPHVRKFSDFKQQNVQGYANVMINQPKMLELLIPAIKNIKGDIKGKYVFSGTFSHPSLTGELSLNKGSFQIPKLNLAVTNVNLTARSEKANIYYKGNLTSGNGTLVINGNSKLEANGLPIDLDLKGNNLLVCNKPEIKVLASPNMHLLLADNTLKLSGKILIPEANIHPHDFSSTETASDDIIFVQPDGKKIENNNLKIISSLQVTLGKNILLNTRGIKGQVLGQIEIEDDPSKATVAYGKLWLQDGSYSVYGKTLEIDDGKLLFTGGPITNPGLNIKASRSLQAKSNSLFSADEKIKVGVSVTGTLKEPKINLFSEPAGKSSEDILSYLILGMPINSLNASANQANTQLLLQAADALNVSGSNKLLNLKDKVKKGLGLSEFDLGTQSEIDPTTHESVQHTAFVLGKYLSPKFYINYSLDIFDHTNTLKVRYLLNKFWTIQSVANTNSSGLDILYTVDK